MTDQSNQKSESSQEILKSFASGDDLAGLIADLKEQIYQLSRSGLSSNVKNERLRELRAKLGKAELDLAQQRTRRAGWPSWARK